MSALVYLLQIPVSLAVGYFFLISHFICSVLSWVRTRVTVYVRALGIFENCKWTWVDLAAVMAVRKLFFIWRDTLTCLTGRTDSWSKSEFPIQQHLLLAPLLYMLQAQWLQKCAQRWELPCQQPWCSEKSYSSRLLADLGIQAEVQKCGYFTHRPLESLLTRINFPRDIWINQNSRRIKHLKLNTKRTLIFNL